MCERIQEIFESKTTRVFVMFVLTIITATIEIVYGIRAHSQSLIADGLYSFAEGICLIGVMLILHVLESNRGKAKRNTFGFQRLELLFGLIQEVFLLSISLGIIVDALNHLVTPGHVIDPDILITVGILGFIVGLIGVGLFWGYHHDKNIAEEISEKKKDEINPMNRSKSLSPPVSPNPEETVKLNGSENKENGTASPLSMGTLSGFTYEHVVIKESRVYATLHALCLHSFVVLLESFIVISTGLLIKYVPHKDPVTGEDVNHWLKYIDPALTLVMVIIIIVRAVPVILSLSDMLIENVPKGIDTDVLMNEIIDAVPEIKQIHSFHIWRASTDEIYATFHAGIDENVMLSVVSGDYGQRISSIFKTYCVRHFTIQFEYIPGAKAGVNNCLYQLLRHRRGHFSMEKQRNSEFHLPIQSE